MRFAATKIPGVVVVEAQPVADERGSFVRLYCADELASHDLQLQVAQCNVSVNRCAGTLRGLHHQVGAPPERKLVRCTRGSAFDVVLDLRPSSPTYLQWTGVTLIAADYRAIFIPEGCAHGFQSLEDDTELLYLMGAPYVPDAARGVRWDDPAFGIRWPLQPTLLSERDAGFPDFRP